MWHRPINSWSDANRILHYRQDPDGRPINTRKIANNTWLERRPTGAIAVRLHRTDVVTWLPSGHVRFDSGGWNTITTRERMNTFGPAWVRLYARKRVMYASIAGRETTFADGLTVGPDLSVEHGHRIPDPAPAAPVWTRAS